MKVLLAVAFASLYIFFIASLAHAFDYKCRGNGERCKYVKAVWAFCQGDLNKRWQELKKGVEDAIKQTTPRRKFCRARNLPITPPAVCEIPRIQVLDGVMKSAYQFLLDLKAECAEANKGSRCRRADRGKKLISACNSINRLVESGPKLPFDYTARKLWLKASLRAIWKAIDTRCRKMRKEAQGPGCCRPPAAGMPGALANRVFGQSELEGYLDSLSMSSTLDADEAKIRTMLRQGKLIVPGGFPSTITGGDQCVLPTRTPTPTPSVTDNPSEPTVVPTITVAPTVTPTISIIPTATPTTSSNGIACNSLPADAVVVSSNGVETCYRVANQRAHSANVVCCIASI